ncbi:uncharacterized protein PHACADRAFT_80041, partial [Phanerochaete carnosa HHB-10118-sp]
MIGRALTRPPRVPSQSLSRAASRRLSHNSSKPRHDPPQAHEPPDHRRSWFWTAQRLSNFVVIPAAILYCVFFADYGESEHVFSPPRRWLQHQRDAFFSLTPEERKLADKK